MSKEQNKGQDAKPATTETTTATPPVPPVEKHIAEPVADLIKVEAPGLPDVAQRTFFNIDLFASQPLMKFDETTRRTKDGKLQVNGDKFTLMTRKNAASALELDNNKDNRSAIDKAIIDEGMVAWRKVKGFLMMLPDEWILKRFVMKKKNNGRTTCSLTIEDLEKMVVDLEKAAEAWNVPVEDLAEFLAAKKAERAKKANATEGKPANATVTVP